MKLTSPLRAALALMFLPGALAAVQTARPLDVDAYDRWSTLHEPALSPGGSYAAWVVEPGVGPGRVVVRELDGDGTLVLPRGRWARFSADGRRLWSAVEAWEPGPHPPRTLTDPDVGVVRRDGDAPGSGAAAPALGSGDTLVVVDLARAFARPGEGIDRIPGGSEAVSDALGRWLAYLDEDRGRSDDGTRTLVVRDLESSGEQRVGGVESFLLSADGRSLWYVVGGRHASLWTTVPGRGRGTRVLEPREGRIRHLALSPDGRRAAVLVREGERDARVDDWTLWGVQADGAARPLVGVRGEGALPPGRAISDALPPRFSDDGRRVFFGTAPERLDAARDSGVDRVRVDVWSWTDAQLQPQQILRSRDDEARAWLAVIPWSGGDAVQLEDEALPEVRPTAAGNGPLALGVSDVPYRRVASWGGRYVDAWRVDVRTGERRRLLEAVRGDVTPSPEGRWATWWDGDARAWMAVEMASGRTVSLSAGIPEAVHDEMDDRPAPPEPYGLAGWTAGDRRVLLYDRWDVWAVDPSGHEAPRNLTGGAGREDGVRLRLVREEDGGVVEWDRATLLSAFRPSDKAAGFYVAPAADAPDGRARPLALTPHAWGVPAGAPDTDRRLVTRESFANFPDVWLVEGDAFDAPRRLSDANAQQAEYGWGHAELVTWTSATGLPLQGILYTPADFDPSRRYPMLVTFYERSSDELHRYEPPAAGGSSINRSVYASRGYLVFVPDIPYRVGHPGQSAVDAVVPGVEALVARGFVDPERIGLQGHSWGGYQVAYLVTRTDIFAAAEAGAPVVNMTSAYGAIRWGSGMSRMFQYEEGQSRIGRSLWDGLDLYVENSPLFAADRITTPLLMLHNDEDASVPWEQGIEMFVALRRLGKPAWLLNYNGEDHGLRREANRRDWAQRMQQFFDHYLRGEAPPVWMAEGVPATRKGETLGLDLVEEAPARRPRPGGR